MEMYLKAGELAGAAPQGLAVFKVERAPFMELTAGNTRVKRR